MSLLYRICLFRLFFERLAGATSTLLNRYRPNATAGAAAAAGANAATLQLAAGSNGMIQQHLHHHHQQHYRRAGLRGSYKDQSNNDNNSWNNGDASASHMVAGGTTTSDPAAVAAVAALELYHRCVFQGEPCAVYYRHEKENKKMMMDELWTHTWDGLVHHLSQKMRRQLNLHDSTTCTNTHAGYREREREREKQKKKRIVVVGFNFYNNNKQEEEFMIVTFTFAICNQTIWGSKSLFMITGTFLAAVQISHDFFSPKNRNWIFFFLRLNSKV